MSRFNNQSFRAVVTPDTDFMVRTEHMPRFKTPEQIVFDGSLTEAIWAHEIMTGFKPTSESQREKYDSQVKILEDFMEQKSVAADIKKVIESFPEGDRDLYINFMRELLPHVVVQTAVKEGLSDQEMEKTGNLVASAFDDVTKRKSKSPFDNVLKALSGVSSLWKSRTP